MDFYVSSVFQSLFFLMLKWSQLWPGVPSLSWFLCPFDMTLLVLESFLAFWHKMSHDHFVHSLPLDLESAISPRSPGSFEERLVLETKI